MQQVSTDPSHGLDRVEHVMGMPIGVEVRDPDVDPVALDRAFDWLRWVDATFSTYKANSEISRLNRGELTLAEVHPDVRDVLERCEKLREETGGYFDIRAVELPSEARTWDASRFPDAVDPSGLVKGWSVERAARILEAAGAHNFCINAGGDIRTRGCPAPTPDWRIGIQHPYIRDRIAVVVAANDLAIATSGTYARGQHIIDPHTGERPTGVLSVTIVGPDLATADAYATAAYAMGEGAPVWTGQLAERGQGYQGMTIMDDDTVLFTDGFPSV